MNERQLNLPKHEDFSGWKRRKTRLTAVTDVAFHSTHRKGYQSKLLVVLSKGGLCNLWGLLDCDDWWSSWWASRVGPQHDRGRSDTVMISMHFNSYASLAIFFIIPVLFSFVFQHETYYTNVSCVWFLLSYVSLQSELSVKTLRTRTVHFVFSLRIFVSAHVIITSITAPGMFTNLSLVLLLLFADSPVAKFRFQLKEKN